MILFFSVLSFFVFLAVRYAYEMKTGSSCLYLEDAIASEVRDKEIEIGAPKKIKNNVTIESNGHLYRLGANDYIPIIAAGDSMESAGIYRGDFVLFDSKFATEKLEKGDLIAIRMRDDSPKNAGKVKLRLFSHIQKNQEGADEVFVNKYLKGTDEVISSEDCHEIASILGVKAAVFNGDFTKSFVAKYSVA